MKNLPYRLLAAFFLYFGIVCLFSCSKIPDGQHKEDVESARIPVVYITTKNLAPIVSKEDYVDASIIIEDLDCMYSQEQYFEGTMRIRGRGNTTWSMPKKPWRIKLDEKHSLLGMPAEKDWCLLANYSDKTLIRNMTAMKLSEICGMQWSPRMRPVEVYLNGMYHGCYTLAEHKEVSEERVDIDVVEDTDVSGDALTGGYYLELDQSMDEKYCFITSRGIPIMFSDPEIPAYSQFEYIKNYLSDFEASLFADDFTTREDHYSDYFDVESLVNFFIIQELSKNIDGNLRKSSFIVKERGCRMQMYHVWDFDIAFGNADYFTTDFGVSNGYDGWYVKDFSAAGRNTGWIWRLFQDPSFVTAVKDRWEELKPVLETDIPLYVDQMSALLADAQARNFKVWQILDKEVWPNTVCLGTYEAEVAYLKNFYLNRLRWIDENLPLL